MKIYLNINQLHEIYNPRDNVPKTHGKWTKT